MHSRLLVKLYPILPWPLYADTTRLAKRHLEKALDVLQKLNDDGEILVEMYREHTVSFSILVLTHLADQFPGDDAW